MTMGSEGPRRTPRPLALGVPQGQKKCSPGGVSATKAHRSGSKVLAEGVPVKVREGFQFPRFEALQVLESSLGEFQGLQFAPWGWEGAVRPCGKESQREPPETRNHQCRKHHEQELEGNPRESHSPLM